MNVRPPGIEPPVAPSATAGAGPAEARPAAPAESAGAAPARDGVEAKSPLHEAALARVADGKPEAGGPAASLSEVLQQRGPNLGDGLQALPEGVRELMQALGKDAPAALGELFKRLARNTQFKALSPEVQAKAAELLGKLAGGEKSDLQNAERLLRTSAFGSLSEKEQLAVLENLATSSEARAELGQMLEKPIFNKLDPPSVIDPGQPILLRELAVEPDASRGSHSEAGDDSSSKLPENQIKRLLGQLRFAPELSQAAVELTLKVTLVPEATALVARPFAGPFQRVELAGARLTLDLREGLTLPFARFAGDLIPVGTAPTLTADGGLVFEVVDQNPRQELRFAFTATAHLLREITIQR